MFENFIDKILFRTKLKIEIVELKIKNEQLQEDIGIADKTKKEIIYSKDFDTAKAMDETFVLAKEFKKVNDLKESFENKFKKISYGRTVTRLLMNTRK